MVVGWAGSDSGWGRSYGWGGAPCLVGGVPAAHPAGCVSQRGSPLPAPRDARPLHLPPGAGCGVTVAAFQRLVASAAPEPAMSGPNMGMPVVPSTEDEDDSFGEAGDSGGLRKRPLLPQGCLPGKGEGARIGVGKEGALPSPAPGWVAGSGRAPASGSLETSASGAVSGGPRFTETEAASHPRALGICSGPWLSPCGDGGPPWPSPSPGLFGWARALAKSASPAIFSAVAWSPGECDLFTKQPVVCTALRWREGG